MSQDFEKVQQRAIQYWFVDGLADLAAGLVSLFLALLVGVWQVISTQYPPLGKPVDE
jgi:hypothetical protein